jgi:hypothetical protein
VEECGRPAPPLRREMAPEIEVHQQVVSVKWV